MKSSLFAFMFLTSALFSCEQDDIKPEDVPVEVRQTILNTFPNAANLEWEKKGEDYEAEFDVAAVEHTALLNAKGSLVQHKYDITEAELPEAVKAAISQQYADFRIDDADVLVKGESSFYQVELEKGMQENKLVFAADGSQSQEAYWD
jgi:uncharacterized membrane protein YkoI